MKIRLIINSERKKQITITARFVIRLEDVMYFVIFERIRQNITMERYL